MAYKQKGFPKHSSKKGFPEHSSGSGFTKTPERGYGESEYYDDTKYRYEHEDDGRYTFDTFVKGGRVHTRPRKTSQEVEGQDEKVRDYYDVREDWANRPGDTQVDQIADSGAKQEKGRAVQLQKFEGSDGETLYFRDVLRTGKDDDGQWDTGRRDAKRISKRRYNRIMNRKKRQYERKLRQGKAGGKEWDRGESPDFEVNT